MARKLFIWLIFRVNGDVETLVGNTIHLQWEYMEYIPQSAKRGVAPTYPPVKCQQQVVCSHFVDGARPVRMFIISECTWLENLKLYNRSPNQKTTSRFL